MNWDILIRKDTLEDWSNGMLSLIDLSELLIWGDKHRT